MSSAIPHLLTVDDVYKGYRLPAGSIVVPNAWFVTNTLIIGNHNRRCLATRAMLHDETVYPEPFEFKPERFMKDGQLDPSVRDPDHAVFGFGRRWVHPY